MDNNQISSDNLQNELVRLLIIKCTFLFSECKLIILTYIALLKN